MPPVDESFILRSIETIQQMSDEDARKGWNLCKTRLWENKKEWELLKAKMIDKGTAYRGYLADRRVLQDLSDQVAYQARLDAAYEERLGESHQEQIRKKPSLNYTSPVKRTIQLVLTKHPEVRGDHRKIADLMDEEGTADVPPDWEPGTRLFAEVHRKGGRNRQKLNVCISTVQSDMQRLGLLPPSD